MQAYACVIIYADAAGLVFVKERTVSPGAPTAYDRGSWAGQGQSERVEK